MPTAESSPPVPSNCIYLVNKYYTWGIFLPLLKQISYTRGTDTDKHLYKVRAAHAEEWNFCLSCYCPCKEGLPCPRGTHQQYAFGYSSAELLKLLRVFEEINYLPQFFLRLINTCNIFKCSIIFFIG